MEQEITNKEILEAMNSFSTNVDKRFDGVENRLKILEEGQDDIKMRLVNVAYRFELQELQQKVENLEKKVDSLAKK